jgi:hypothetical protein
MEQYHQVQKEFEDLKEAKSAAEASLVAFKSRVQQLEKEAQTCVQVLSKLENQVLSLSEENLFSNDLLTSVRTPFPPTNIVVIIKIMKFLALGL